MRIPKQDALNWYRFFAELPEDEPLSPRQEELKYAVLRQLEDAAAARRQPLLDKLRAPKTLGGRTMYVGPDEKFPAGCRSCLHGTGLSAVRRTNRCDANCPFCYDYGQLDRQPPIGDGLWEIGGGRCYAEDLPLLLSASRKPTGVAYVYLEPMLEIEQYYPVIRAFRDAGVHQHLYTNGIRCTEEILRDLGEAGLDEIRFNLGATGASDHVIGMIAAAKRHIPQAGVETPMTPEFEAAFHRKKAAILATGLDFINCAELHLNDNNIVNYWGESLYACRAGYISPVWSREITLRLMAEAEAEDWPVAVHDCSNMTKFARDLNLCAKEGGWFGRTTYGMEFEAFPYAAFLPALEDDSLPFVSEEPLPPGYRAGDIVF